MRESIAIGPRLESVIMLAWRARKPLLLIGRSGIGKSEIVCAAARRLGIQHAVLDLSLLEPPDLTGLPYREGGRTRYAVPAMLPTEGDGIVVLEELNRADRAVRQPVLQLLSSGRLNDYVLPKRWTIAASINPDDGDFQVDALDPALADRFMTFEVHASRAEWLIWAQASGVHPVVMELVEQDEHAFDDVSPRTWKHVSDLLLSVEGGESQSSPAHVAVLRDAVGGYLPQAWVEVLFDLRARHGGDWFHYPRRLLRSLAQDALVRERLMALREEGRTDVLEKIAGVALEIVSSPNLETLTQSGDFDIDAFEVLLAALPGDHAERLQEAFGANPEAWSVCGVRPEQVLHGFREFGAERQIKEWLSQRATQHRVWALVTGLVGVLERWNDVEKLHILPGMWAGIGSLLAMLPEPRAKLLRAAAQRLNIEPANVAAGLH